MKKLIIVGVIALVVLLFFALDLNHTLTLEGLKSSLSQFERWKTESLWFVMAGFFVLYVVVTALSLPGAAVMTLAAGALFGLVYGTILVSFASSLGATLAFLASRYLLRESVERRFRQRMQQINAGVEQEGGFYLFTLRLVPIFPFFLINLVMGLTTIRAATFYWVSQVGMLAGTIVYVNAGTQLAQIESLGGIISPSLLLSFALLGLFPLFAKKLVNSLQARRAYRGWRKPSSFDRNLIVLGAGAGGLVSAYIAAAVNAKVTLVEAHKMGGDCLNFGCVPSKALIKSAKVAHQIKKAGDYGVSSGPARISFSKVMQGIHEKIAAIAPHDSVERYTELGVEVKQGYGRLIDPWTVEIESSDGDLTRLTSRAIVIATGARPFVPPLPGLNEVDYVTSDTLWDTFAQLQEPPERLVVLGGGPIGCELSQSFSRLGVQVTQVEMASRLLLREDDEVSAFARQTLEQEGVKVLTDHKALRCYRQGARQYLVVEHEGMQHDIEFDQLLCAVGRVPRTSGFGLEALGIKTDRTVTTDDYLQTMYPNILAVGDVVGPYQFTHVAAHQAWYAAVNGLFGQLKKFKVDYRVIPATTFMEPEIARVGLNEREASEQNIEYEISRYQLDDLDRAIVEGETRGFVKVLTEPGKDRILGATIVGEHAGELLAEFVLAMKHGLGLNKILGTIHAYPTWAESNKYVAGVWKKDHAPQRILEWLQRYHTWRRA